MERPSFDSIQPQKKLAPLNEGGPMQLLHLQVSIGVRTTAIAGALGSVPDKISFKLIKINILKLKLSKMWC